MSDAYTEELRAQRNFAHDKLAEASAVVASLKSQLEAAQERIKALEQERGRKVSDDM